MSRPFIPFSSPWITDAEIQAVSTCLRERKIAASADNFRGAQEALKRLVDGQDVVLTTSCTSALELALMSLKLPPGSEVLLPSYTFVSSANAIIRSGLIPRFVDIEDQTLNIDLRALELAIRPETKVVMPVHYNGISCDMDQLMQIARKYGLHVVEDAAHAVGARYKGKPLGTFGDFGCFSFHDTKNIVSGEGGAVVLNTANHEALEVIYEKGTNRSAFLRGEVDKYTWVDVGGSFPMSGILASLLRVQLDRYDDIRERRRALCSFYAEGLRSLEESGDLVIPRIPETATAPYHLSYFLMRDVSRRHALLSHLREYGVGATFHYVPLHLSPYAQEHLGCHEGMLPVTERVAASIVRLPLYPHLSQHDCQYIIQAVHAFFRPDVVPPPPLAMPATHDDCSESESLDVSLVIACYNEESHLHANLSSIVDVLHRQQLQYELIIIDDCSPDRTSEKIREYVSLHSQLPIRTVFHRTNVGRGATVSEGFRLSRGRIVGFIDIDLEVKASYIPGALLPLLKGKADMVIADRTYTFHTYAFHRYLMTKCYRFLVQSILHTPSMDTEAGFKFFRKSAILPLLNDVLDKRWFWDTEISVTALDRGLRLHNEPVLFDRKEEKASTVKAFRDSWRSLAALVSFALKRSRQK